MHLTSAKDIPVSNEIPTLESALISFDQNIKPGNNSRSLAELLMINSGPNMTIEYPYPNENLPMEQDSVKIRVITDVNASCQYSTSDFIYGTGKNFTTGQGCTVHTLYLNDLHPGKKYTFYYRAVNGTTYNINSSKIIHTFGVFEKPLKIVSNCVRVYSSEPGDYLRDILDNNAGTAFISNAAKEWSDSNTMTLNFKLPDKTGYTTKNFSISYFRFRSSNITQCPDLYDVVIDGKLILSNCNITPIKNNTWAYVDIPDNNLTYKGGSFKLVIKSVQGNGYQKICISDIEIFSTEMVDYVHQTPQMGFVGIPRWWNDLQWAYSLHLDDVDNVSKVVNDFGWLMPLTMEIWDLNAYTRNFGNVTDVVSKGHEYGSHGMSHMLTEQYSYSQGRAWVDSSKKFVESNIINTSRWSGNTVISLSYPFNRPNYHVTTAAYDTGFRISGQVNSLNAPGYNPAWNGFAGGIKTTRDELDWMLIQRSLGNAVNTANQFKDGTFEDRWNWTRENGLFGDAMIHQTETMHKKFVDYVLADKMGWQCTLGEVRSYYYYYQHANIIYNQTASSKNKHIYDINILYEHPDDPYRIWKVPITFEFDIIELALSKTGVIEYLENVLKLKNIEGTQRMCEGYRFVNNKLFISVIKNNGDKIVIYDNSSNDKIPKIIATYPENNQNGIVLDENIVVVFSSPINNLSVIYNCIPNPGGWNAEWSNFNTVVKYSHDPFISSTLYTFRIITARDISGFELSSGTIPNPWTFYTVDAVPPVITKTYPWDNTHDIELDQVVNIEFSEPIKTESINFSCTPDPGNWIPVWNDHKNIVNFTHDQFSSSTKYIFKLNSAKDLAGNELVANNIPNPWTFTTRDIIPPYIISTFPGNASRNIVLSTAIQVIFSEPMNKKSLNFSCIPNPSGWSSVWDHDNCTVNFLHSPFKERTLYRFSILTACDMAGNALSNGSIVNPWVFRTVEFVKPKVIAILPFNNALDVPLNEKIIITFDKEMVSNSINFKCTPNPGGWEQHWNSENTVLKLNHNQFNDSTEYIFEVIYAKDTQGKPLGIGEVPREWKFNTIDNTPPTILATEPVNSAISVPLDQDILIVFSEKMNCSSVSFSCNPDPGGWIAKWSSDGRKACYSHNPFKESQVYKFKILTGKDFSKNLLNNGEKPNPWIFKTVDNTSPWIVSTYPINYAERVRLNEDIIVRFSEPMNKNSLIFNCTPDPNGWKQIWVDNLTVKLSHNQFRDLTYYIFQILSCNDQSENQLVMDYIQNPWLFRTIDTTKPMILAISPLPGSKDVLPTASISVTFNKEMKTSSVKLNSTPNPNGWTKIWYNENRTVVFSHLPFKEKHSYTFEIYHAEDIFSNILLASMVPNKWNYTVKDVTPPILTAITPFDKQKDVDVNQEIIMKFNEPMSNMNFSYQCIPDPMGWTISWIDDSKTVKLLHNNFQRSTTFTFIIKNAEDLAGNNFILDDTLKDIINNRWSFSTFNNTPPEIISKPEKYANIGEQYIYNIKVIDIENDSFIYDLTQGPAGMYIDGKNGTLIWVPDTTQTGTYKIIITVTDSFGGETNQIFKIISNPVIKSTGEHKHDEANGTLFSWSVLIISSILITIMFVIFHFVLIHGKRKKDP